MVAKYVKAHEVNVGDLIYLAYSSSTPSRVLEVSEPTHALAGAYGALALTIETYAMSDGRPGRVRRISAWPDTDYRLEQSPEVWLCAARSCKCCAQPRAAYRVSELVSAGVLAGHGVWGSKAYIHLEANRSQRGAVVNVMYGVDQGSTIDHNRRVRHINGDRIGTIDPSGAHCSYGVTVDFRDCKVYIDTNHLVEMCASAFCEREAAWRFSTPVGIRHACDLLSHAPREVDGAGVAV